MKIRHYFVLVSSMAFTLAWVGCTSSPKKSDSVEVANNPPQDTSSEEVISDLTTPSGNTRAGTVAERGETEVEGEREVIIRRTETVKEGVPTVSRKRLDVNRMDAQDFVALGLEQEAADRVISQRDQLGSFTSIDDLAAIEGIDANWLNQYRDQFAFVPMGDAEMAGEAAAE